MSFDTLYRSKLKDAVVEKSNLTQQVEDRHAAILSNHQDMRVTGMSCTDIV